MFSYILFLFCFFFLIPFAIGILISLVLRELYKKQLWEKSIADQENERELQKTQPENNTVKLYDPSLDEIESENSSVAETDAKQVQNSEPIAAEPGVAELDSASNSEPLPSSAITDLPTADEIPAIPPSLDTLETSELPETSERSDTSETSEIISGSEQLSPTEENASESDSESKSPSAFDNQDVSLAETLKVNEILDEMVNETPPIIPADISLRLEEDGTPESRLNQMENEIVQDLLEPDENEILTQIAAPTDSTNQPFLQPDMMPNDIDHEIENTNTVHSGIAPLAIELLGEDFNFNSFFDEKSKSKQKNKEEPITVHEIGQGIYQADGGFPTIVNDQILHHLLPKEQEIVSVYPDDLVQNAVVEPDVSETAQNFSFTEELLPMLTRKKNKK
ncbi:MAG: hypothetical protein LBI18_01015 [Planctomycetaceae bacterium]|nr:hypothetical protein [Planctomycetaceae bacterium]